MDDDTDGYSGLFWIMLTIGIIGALGFVITLGAAGS